MGGPSRVRWAPEGWLQWGWPQVRRMVWAPGERGGGSLLEGPRFVGPIGVGTRGGTGVTPSGWAPRE